MTFIFPEEDLMATAADGQGFFIARPEFGLKAGRYIIKRKLGRGLNSSTYLVFDQEDQCYSAAKILTVSATTANEQGILKELECLKLITKDQTLYSTLILLDHFWERSVHGAHLCLITQVYGIDAHRFMMSVPEGSLLASHVVVQIMTFVVTAVRELHDSGIIHGDLRAENVWIEELSDKRINECIEVEPLKVAGVLKVNEEEHPLMISQPLKSSFPWNVSPLQSELINGTVGDLGSALLDSEPKPMSDIGALALRSPENVVGTYGQCGKPLDIWAIGCLAYEFLTGRSLFSPIEGDNFTQDEHHLALMQALTGEAFPQSLIGESSKRNEYFDDQGALRKASIIPTPTQTIEGLLRQYSKISEKKMHKAVSFIQGCTRLDPAARLTAAALEVHPWIEDT